MAENEAPRNENYLERQLRIVKAMLDGTVPHEKIRVVKCGDDEIIAAGSLGVGGGQSGLPQMMVFAPISIGLEGDVVVADSASAYGAFSERTFSFDDFIVHCDGDNLRTITGEDARRIVAFLRENPEITRKGPLG